MMEPVTLGYADEFCRERGEQETKTCESCARCDESWVLRGRKESECASALKTSGWEREWSQRCWLMRCYECRGIKEHAWLLKADRERVRDWLQKRCDESPDSAWVIDWNDLKRSTT